ncbi:YdcH family protein [Pseudoxanthomonas sp. JBR18]|uniref:YdcH family protein n=1 Tax=Pseudoxanthomonas sp. JBR18 TaxID=2969308 RepID=UPI002306492A|nr:YdcH family protein [Pseudoxanthomonas sp. JBR18]WCE05502.1 YdcH family protein [Pseudoxanthomonas sp. JBR18]
MDNGATEEVVSRLTRLRREHRDLDEEILRLLAGIQADELSVKRLKKRKLWLKDCIARLESALIPDEPA